MPSTLIFHFCRFFYNLVSKRKPDPDPDPRHNKNGPLKNGSFGKTGIQGLKRCNLSRVIWKTMLK